MAARLFRVVLDTNVVVRALVNLRATSGHLLAAEQHDILLLLSKPCWTSTAPSMRPALR